VTLSGVTIEKGLGRYGVRALFVKQALKEYGVIYWNEPVSEQAPIRWKRQLLTGAVLGVALTALASCAYWNLWDGDPAASLSDSPRWVVLPMRSFVSRENITVEGMQLCTLRRCGYDAAIERFIVTGRDAAQWEKALTQPAQLAALVGKPYPKSILPKPVVSAEPFSTGSWTGLQLAMTGGKKAHHFNSYVVGERNANGTTFIVVVAANADIARKLVLEAAR